MAACEGDGVSVYMGDGTVCLGDNDGNTVDDLCEGVVPTGGCCLPDGSCTVTTATTCAAASGTYLGDNTFCLGDLDGDQIDDACEPGLTGACCFEDGSCASGITRLDCTMGGGTYMGDGSVCLGDGDGNQVDDLCEGLPQLKWFQPPDLTPDGMDVNATYDPTGGGLRPPYLLADDFLCTQTGPVTEIHIFGSWVDDVLPQGSPAAVTFYLSFHPDVPAGTIEPYSMPGPSFWNRTYGPGQFEVRVHAANIVEGWFDAPQTYVPLGDRVCYEYIFRLGPQDFVQEGTPQQPVVYWLNVQATPVQSDTYFGWKTSTSHWNDDGTYFMGMDDPGGQLPWQELRYPDLHPLHPASIDLAFQLWSIAEEEPTGACCYDDGSCTGGMTSADCVASGGSYGGDGSSCAGVDNDGNGVDDFCDGVVTLGACCYGSPATPTCVNTTPTICGQTLGGTFYVGQNCATFICPSVTTGACCYPDGSCADLTAAACAQSSGSYQGDGTQCLGDADQNGIDDACEGADLLKWQQMPDLSPNGMDVMCTETKVLADDFQCTETGQISKIEIWGSWYQDGVPNGDPGDVDFVLSLHSDIPSTSGVSYPAGCPYVTTATPLLIVDGLPPGTTIDINARLDGYMNVYHEPGGSLQGEIVMFDATLYMDLTGTGALAGYSRTLAVPVACEVHTACVPPEPCHDYAMQWVIPISICCGFRPASPLACRVPAIRR